MDENKGRAAATSELSAGLDAAAQFRRNGRVEISGVLMYCCMGMYYDIGHSPDCIYGKPVGSSNAALTRGPEGENHE